MAATQLAMKVASMGRAARSKAGLKVRQPLANVLVKVRVPEEREYINQVRPQVLEELNIKDIQVIEDDAPLVRQVLEEAGDQTETILSVENYSVSLDGGYMVAVNGELNDELKEEGLAREVVHRIQGMRRSANFDVTDRIVTYYQGPSEFADIMQGAFSDYIRNETLSNDLVDGSPGTESTSDTVKIEGMDITLAVRQA
jgi:isoleucyl-tRNA synthetase